MPNAEGRMPKKPAHGTLLLRALTLSAFGIWHSAFLLACTSGDNVQYLSIATGDTGGVYYAYGGGLAKVISEHVPGVRATAESTAASVDNLKLIRAGKADVAFALADTAADAIKGEGPFAEGGAVPARALAVLYYNYLHIVTLEGSGIRSLADLRRRVVSTGLPGSGTEITSRRVLAAAGIDPDRDLTRRSLGPTQGADALKDGKLDALCWSGGLPTPAFLDLAHSPNVRMTLVPTADALDALRREHADLYTRLEIPAGTYRGVDATPVVGVANLLVVRADMPEDLAYQLTRVLFERQADLAAVHPEARKLSLRTAMSGSPLEFHAGAARYYREMGVREVP
jgi:TRAP transporter TAXI family solute receptor